jgi:hypothetical protein
MDNTPVTTAEMLRQMQAGWDELQAYVKRLTPEQLTTPTDAGGWTAKDHIIHLAVWADGVEARLIDDSRQARMGISDATWKSDWKVDDFFSINDEIFRQHKNESLDAVLMTFKTVHEQIANSVSKLSDADLMRPSFDPVSPSTHTIASLIAGNTFGHYAEHRPWIAAIVDGN